MKRKKKVRSPAARARNRGTKFEWSVCSATAKALGVPYEELRRSWAGEEALRKGDAVMSDRVKKMFPFQIFCRRYTRDRAFSWDSVIDKGIFRTSLGRWFLEAESKTKRPVLYVVSFRGTKVWFGLCAIPVMERFLRSQKVPCFPEPYIYEYDVASSGDALMIFSYRRLLDMIKRGNP